MKSQSIAAATAMGTVDLAVTDADRALRFYRDYVGLTPLPGTGPEVHMGAAGRELLVLHPGAERPVVPRTSGLYHFAILVPDRRELARVIGRLARVQWDQYPTDHVMTKANYLWDPDGNGIEIYTESPEDGTMGFANGTFVVHDKDGRERSGRDPIDMEELFSHLLPGDRLDAPMPRGTTMGHVHLHVADVEDALRFYHDLVGFDVMGHIPGVGFVSAGGYHHHLGLNEWAGQGARPAPANSSGLRRFTVELPTQSDLEDVVSRLEHGQVRVGEEDGGFVAVDPSANRVVFKVAAALRPGI
jgi:catechol 2,3-dioxygenase